MKADYIGGLFWLIIGSAAIYGAVRLGIGTLREPESGFLPFLAGCVICLLAGGIMLQASFTKGGAKGSLGLLWKEARISKLLSLGFLLLAYVFAFERFGFLLTTFVILFAIFRAVEGLSWRKTIVVSLVTSASSYVFLAYFLKATLPKGFFGF